ncbi:hypothetical protein [Rhodovulum euryhalinum]|uniref:Uncharacterized protein n=1 Tax=Rhodovulum euryhalinum TaxID=35805 RepID=A0A4R2KKB6_9RHOB|nr:hypothetical protein [Rhodovulum euryhalinum]TCO70468.1 hypothetical protein EV655_10914 [Rhodovulum euryhalinum]
MDTEKEQSTGTGEAAEIAPPLSAEDIASRILGFTRFCMGQASERLEQAALSRGWIDEEGRPTADGRALITALTSGECAYGVYRLPV